MSDEDEKRVRRVLRFVQRHAVVDPQHLPDWYDLVSEDFDAAVEAGALFKYKFEGRYLYVENKPESRKRYVPGRQAFIDRIAVYYYCNSLDVERTRIAPDEFYELHFPELLDIKGIQPKQQFWCISHHPDRKQLELVRTETGSVNSAKNKLRRGIQDALNMQLVERWARDKLFSFVLLTATPTKAASIRAAAKGGLYEKMNWDIVPIKILEQISIREGGTK